MRCFDLVLGPMPQVRYHQKKHAERWPDRPWPALAMGAASAKGVSWHEQFVNEVRDADQIALLHPEDGYVPEEN